MKSNAQGAQAQGKNGPDLFYSKINLSRISHRNKRVELTSGPAGAGPSAAHTRRYTSLMQSVRGLEN